MTHDELFDLADRVCIRTINDDRWKPISERLLTLCEKHENNGWKRKTGMTQELKVLNHIKTAGSITVREALVEYSVNSLTKRISNLRAAGHSIVSNVKSHPVTGQRYVRYTLAA